MNVLRYKRRNFLLAGNSGQCNWKELFDWILVFASAVVGHRGCCCTACTCREKHPSPSTPR